MTDPHSDLCSGFVKLNGTARNLVPMPGPNRPDSGSARYGNIRSARRVSSRSGAVRPMDNPSKHPMEMMARWGYGARGAVYCLVGGLAVLAAFGSGGQTGGSHSA